MKTMEDLLNNAINRINPNCNEKEREKYQDIMLQLFDGKPLSKALGMTPEMLEYLYSYGYRLYNSGNYKNAAIIFAFLTTIFPDKSKYYLALAASLHMQSKFQEAVNMYMEAFYLDMKDPLPFYHISDCYIKMNKPEYAAFALGMVINQASDKPEYAKIKERAELAQNSLGKELEKLSSVK